VQSRGSLAVVAGRYELDRELTRGPTSAVWRARDTLLGRNVVLEIVRPALADDPAFAERLAFESRRIAPLAVPGLARLLDTGREDGVPYLVREDVAGATVRELVAADGPFTVERGTVVTLRVLEALEAVHEAGVMHLGLRSDAVFVGPGDEVGVTGLGVCSALEPDADAIDPRTDVFAAAEVAFELLTAEQPDGRRSVRASRPDVPRRVDRAIARALAPDVDERFASAAAFAAALTAPETADPGDAHRGVWRTWLAVPIFVAVAAVGVIAAGLWLGRLEVGGPLGIRAADPKPNPRPSSALPAFTSAHPVDATAFDPFGDGTENSSLAPLAIDGDETTAWRSEDYFDASLHKDGVGLVFDLGERRDIIGYRLWTPHPGFVFHVAVGDDPQSLVDDIGPSETAQAETRGSIEGRGRYVLLWITTVVDTGDGHRAEVGEFRPLVSTDG
jgi:eukaryotic-like serine/threonine-protein kinase